MYDQHTMVFTLDLINVVLGTRPPQNDLVPGTTLFRSFLCRAHDKLVLVVLVLSRSCSLAERLFLVLVVPFFRNQVAPFFGSFHFKYDLDRARSRNNLFFQ